MIIDNISNNYYLQTWKIVFSCALKSDDCQDTLDKYSTTIVMYSFIVMPNITNLACSLSCVALV